MAVAKRKRRKQHKSQPVSELIGRTALPNAQASIYRSRLAITSIDQTVPDYAFWDRLRRCQAAGYKLGGLFAKRIENVIAAWVLGGGLTVTLADEEGESEAIDYTNTQLADFLKALLDSGQEIGEETEPDRDDTGGSLLMGVFKDTLGLGDQYIVVNADGSLSIPSPDTVTVTRNELDYRLVESITIETKLSQYTIFDEIRADGRTVTIKKGTEKGTETVSVQQYQNLIGRINVIHVAYGRSGNETNGHSIHEELRPLYDQYDDLLYKQLDGAKLLGNPILTFAGMKDINAVKNANDPAMTDTYLDRDGNEVPHNQFNIDSNAVLLIGEGGSASFTAPPVGFTEDTKMALKSLFLMLLEHTGIPESVWGGELSSARATSDTQLGQFVKEVESWQRDAGGWIVRLCKIWLQTKALTDPQIVVGRLAIEWPDLLQEDKEIKLKYLEFADKAGLLTGEKLLEHTELSDDPATDYADGQAQAEEKQRKAMEQADSFGSTLGNATNDAAAIEAEFTVIRPDVHLLEMVTEVRRALAEVAN